MIEFKWSKVHRPAQTPIIKDVEIEDLVEELLKDYKPQLLEQPMPVNPEHFAETYMGIDIEYQRIASPDNNVVGAMVFNDECLPVYREDGTIHLIRVPANTIVIHEDTACDDKLHRFMRFTILHECGHAWMHANVYRRQALSLFGGTEINKQMTKCFRSYLTCSKRSLVTEEDFREHQANVFAAAIAMPRATFVPYAKRLLMQYGLEGRFSPRYVEDSRSFRDTYNNVLLKLAKAYDVSCQSVDIKLHKLGLVKSEISLVS